MTILGQPSAETTPVNFASVIVRVTGFLGYLSGAIRLMQAQKSQRPPHELVAIRAMQTLSANSNLLNQQKARLLV